MIISGATRIPATAAARPGRHDDTPATGTALVPLIATVERAPVSQSVTRHDAYFIAQLIAMEQRSPQTRVLRRATPEDARATYRVTTAQNASAAEVTPRVLRIV